MKDIQLTIKINEEQIYFLVGGLLVDLKKQVENINQSMILLNDEANQKIVDIQSKLEVLKEIHLLWRKRR